MAEDLESTIETAAGSPAEVSAFGQTVKQQSIPDLIAADRYLQAKNARRKKTSGLRFVRLVPPGTVGEVDE